MIRRGEIYWVDWSPGRGSEQTGVRPAVILQNNVGNQFSPTTIVAAISTRVPPKLYPFHVRLSPEESGLLDAIRLRDVETAVHRSLGMYCG